MNLNDNKFQSATLASILQIEEFKIKFDTPTISNSLAIIVGDYVETLILQQFNYFITQGYGVILKGIRWIYKSIRELIIDAFPILSPWQIGKAIASLVEKGFLIREHLFAEHHGHNFHPKNRTYYYTVNYGKIFETAQNVRFAVSPKTVSGNPQKLFSDCPKNKTKNTSKEHNQRKDPTPTPPKKSVDFWEEKNPPRRSSDNQSVSTEEPSNNPVSVSEVLEKETNAPHVEEKINMETKINVEPKVKVVQKTPKGTKPRRKDAAPWKDEGEFKRFWRELVKALPIIANAHSPQGLAQTIVTQLKAGIPHTYWDDFKEGREIGTSTMQEWEISPGVIAPKFIEYLKEKIRDAHDSNSKALLRVSRLLKDKTTLMMFWREFKRSVEALRQDNEKAIAEGRQPYIPVWFTDRADVSLERAAESANYLNQVNPTSDWVEEGLSEEQSHRQLPQSDFDSALCACVRELKEAAKYGYVSSAKRYIQIALNMAKTEQDKARLRTAIKDIYPDLQMTENE